MSFSAMDRQHTRPHTQTCRVHKYALMRAMLCVLYLSLPLFLSYFPFPSDYIWVPLSSCHSIRFVMTDT